MGQLVFKRLGEQFSKLCDTRQKADIIETQNVMRAAGRAFYEAISSKKIDLGDIPSWFKEKPKKANTYSWDLYWWCVVAWLIRKKPDSGIFCSPTVKRMKFKKELLGYSLRKYLIGEEQLPREKCRKVCYRLAKASETACCYLADIINDTRLSHRSEEKTAKKDSEPPTDLIDLTKALTSVQISRTQIKRDIAAGKIKSYRKNPRGKHIVSLAEMQKVYLTK